MEFYTMRQFVAALGVDHKTVLKWMREMGIEGTPKKHNQSIIIITRAQAERIAQEYQVELREIPLDLPVTLLDCHKRIIALEQEIAELRRRLADLEFQRATIREQQVPRHSTYVSSQWYKDEMGDNHNTKTHLLTQNAVAMLIAAHMGLSDWTAKSDHLPNMGDDDKRDRASVVVWLRTTGRFRRECTQESCPCHLDISSAQN